MPNPPQPGILRPTRLWCLINESSENRAGYFPVGTGPGGIGGLDSFHEIHDSSWQLRNRSNPPNITRLAFLFSWFSFTFLDSLCSLVHLQNSERKKTEQTKHMPNSFNSLHSFFSFFFKRYVKKYFNKKKVVKMHQKRHFRDGFLNRSKKLVSLQVKLYARYLSRRHPKELEHPSPGGRGLKGSTNRPPKIKPVNFHPKKWGKFSEVHPDVVLWHVPQVLFR